MGKSALTWKWFQTVLPNERPDLVGRIWWSFYESAARFENFVIRALVYIRGMSREAVEKLTPPEREERLVGLLRSNPYLLVLDGLERILIAYAHMDAARMMDGDLDARTGNRADGGDPHLRKTADPRAGEFLRKLAAEGGQSRVLVTTRLYPADLERSWNKPLAGCVRLDLTGLTDDDAVNLWRQQGVNGTREALMRLFHQFGSYPLLITALAGRIADDPRAAGDFDVWLANNPRFAPDMALLTDQDRHAHVLKYALEGLDDAEKTVLNTLAAFRMPASYTTVAAVHVKNNSTQRREYAKGVVEKDLTQRREDAKNAKFVSPVAIFEDEAALIAVLRTLGDRGLIGWDNRPGANRYDLHPIVRAVAWGGLDSGGRVAAYEALRGHFDAMPKKEEDEIETLDDLTPAIELYNTLVGLGRYDDAFYMFFERIRRSILYRLSTSYRGIEMLEELFPNGREKPPRLTEETDQAYTLNVLGITYKNVGQVGYATSLFQRSVKTYRSTNDLYHFVLTNLSNVERLSGNLRKAEISARQALRLEEERQEWNDVPITLQWLALGVSSCGNYLYAIERLEAAKRLFEELKKRPEIGYVASCRAQVALWEGDWVNAQKHAQDSWEMAAIDLGCPRFQPCGAASGFSGVGAR